MNKILIASHGHLASGIQSSLDILTGLGKEVSVIDAYVDDRDYTKDIKTFVEDLHGKTGVIFTDLLGGSVNQKVMLEVAQQKNIFVITGTNLAIVLSVALSTEPVTKESLQELISASQVQLVEVSHDDADLSDDSFLE